MEALLGSVPTLSEQLGPERATDLQRKAEDIRAQWNSIYRLISEWWCFYLHVLQTTASSKTINMPRKGITQKR